jgi:hypothetical protein
MRTSKFDLSHNRLTTAPMGCIVPLTWYEALPGDIHQQSTSALIRMAPLNAPVMHPLHVSIHHWFVPIRLLWDNWEAFITGGSDGMNDSEHPYMTTPASTGVQVNTLLDYMGIPLGVPDQKFSALPIRAYNLIYNEYYRDQDLIDPMPISKADGSDTTTNQLILNGAWEKDYFTSARADSQKGPEISLPLGTRAPVKGIGKQNTSFPVSNQAVYETDASGTVTYPNSAQIYGHSVADTFFVEQDPDNTNHPNIWADLAEATAATVNELRLAMALQRYEEARSRYGSRYTEYLAYLGIRCSDARLQRPEYLGGGKNTIQFSEVLQTAPNTTSGSSGDTGVGDLLGHGISATKTNRFRRFFEEHGIVMTVMIVRPKTIYMQGLFRKWNRLTKEDYWQKELEHIGQQIIQNKEIYLAHTTPEGKFGTQDRYDEYRRCESEVTGSFRTTLKYWNMAREFSTSPALNGDFVTSLPTTRILQAPSEPPLYVMANHSIQSRRLVSKTGDSYIY